MIILPQIVITYYILLQLQLKVVNGKLHEETLTEIKNHFPMVIMIIFSFVVSLHANFAG